MATTDYLFDISSINNDDIYKLVICRRCSHFDEPEHPYDDEPAAAGAGLRREPIMIPIDSIEEVCYCYCYCYFNLTKGHVVPVDRRCRRIS